MDKLEKVLEQIDEKVMSICSEHMNGDCIIDSKLEHHILGIKRSIIDTYGVPYHLESYADTFKIVFDDNNFNADMEAQDYDVFGENKI